MNDDQITALAREYAEWVTDVPKAKELPNCLRNEANKLIADNAEYMLTWLSRRYCLVEKSKVEEEYHEAKFACGNVDPCSETWATYLAQKDLLERLFPDLGKEVEG